MAYEDDLEKQGYNNYQYHLQPFKFWTLQNFPFIESADFDSLTNYEIMCKIVDYLNKTIANMNIAESNDEITQTNITNAINYINNYFDNLDVTDDINNKLDQMASTGQLQGLLNELYNELETSVDNRLDEQDITIASINNKVDSVSSGSPAGVYSTVSDLTTADPNHNRIYLVTADGNWYYYNTSTSTWTSGGNYQSTGIGENGVKPYQEDIIIKNNLFPYDGWIPHKTININSGAVMNFESGSYNPRHIPFTAGITYVWTVMSEIFGTKNFRVAFYKEDDTYISSSNTNIQNGYDLSFVVPEDTSYGIVHTFTTPIDNVYPSNFPALLSETNYLNLYDFSKPIYLNDRYQLVNNDNVYCQDKIEFTNYTPYSDKFLLSDVVSGYINKYTLKGNRTVSSNYYPFVHFKINNPTAGDKIRLSFPINDSHLTTIGFYVWQNQTTYTNFTYNNATNEWELTLTNDMINNYLINNIGRICLRFSGITGSTTLNFTMTINANNLCNNFTDIINKLNEIKEVKSYKGMFLGDSITQLTGERSWITYFSQIVPLSHYDNIAVIGATLMDKQGTVYDGNPVYNGADNNVNNVLGNQVQKIINGNYTVPDFIMIAIGTNGGITFDSVDEIYSTYWNSDGTVKDLSTVDRKTSAGAFRYCNEKLHELYPNAMIIWCTPIQANTLSKNVKNTIQYGENLKVLCAFGSNYCIDTEKCGILGINEIPNVNGEDLIDGLHPNSHGAKKMGTFNACEFKKFLDKIDLYQ